MNPLKKLIATSATLLMATVLPSLASAAGTETTKPLNVYTSILPQRYFVEKIGGEQVNVSVLVSPGKSPATYEPTPQQVLGLGEADALFTLGVPFESAFLPAVKNTLPGLKIVDTAAGIEKRDMVAHHHEGEEEHDDHDHEAEVKDPHIWMSPRLVKVQAQHIYNALVEMDPSNQPAYQQGFNTLIAELNDVDTKLAETLAPFKGETLFVYHPALGYFADDYGLHQEAIETGGKEPSPAALAHVIEHAREEGVKIIFVQPEFSQNSARSIAQAIDGAVLTLQPLNPDYINNLLHIASELEKAFQ